MVVFFRLVYVPISICASCLALLFFFFILNNLSCENFEVNLPHPEQKFCEQIQKLVENFELKY